MSIAIITRSKGRTLNVLLNQEKIKKLVSLIVSDRECEAIDVASKHGVPGRIFKGQDNAEISSRMASYCMERDISHILSINNPMIITQECIDIYRGRIFNSHCSILPAFPGRKGVDWTTDLMPPKHILERAIKYGARLTGNTIHILDEEIDSGFPVIQSSMPIPYDMTFAEMRHRLFIQECKTIMQFCIWLSAGRIHVNEGGVRIDGATFWGSEFSPDLEEHWIKSFSIPDGRRQK